MKLSWGYRVTLLYIGFAGLIIYLVTRSVNEKIDLVTPDYYAQELKYQDRIESLQNNSNLDQPLSIDNSDAGIVINFPSELKGQGFTGSIVLFRPSDKGKDKEFEVSPDAALKQLIPVSDLEKGMYRVKVEFQSGGKNYYSEKQVVVR